MIRGNKKGFTLIETIIALSIFVMTLLITVNIYLVVHNAQRKVVALQRVQDDVRYLFEAIAQEVRLGDINYEFYNDPIQNMDLYPGAQNITYLAVLNQLHEEIYFRLLPSTSDKAQYCAVNESNDCDPAVDENWENITPDSVEITKLDFLITPSANPYVDVTVESCALTGDQECVDAGLISYRCDVGVTNTCLYYSDGQNFQPKVRILLTANALDSTIPEQSRTINMQTIISSRLYSGKVQNLNYE